MHHLLRSTACALAVFGAVGVMLGAAKDEGQNTQALARFAALKAADQQLNVQTTQVRRVRDQFGRMVGVVEHLVSGPDGFRLDPIPAVGAGSGSEEHEAADRYRAHAGFIHRHQSFRVHDASLASQNYAFWPLDMSVRAGRAVQRALVIPRVLDRSVWLLELDQATGYPLYRAEYDHQLQLVSELEVQSFELHAGRSGGSGQNGNGSANGWTPMFLVTDYPTPQAARQALGVDGDTMELPDASLLGWGFRNHQTFLSEHLFDPERKVLVLGFTDGIDEAFFLQDESPDPLAALPSQSSNAGSEARPQTILRFVDQNVRQYTFHERGVLAVVVGRGSQLSLDDACRGFLRRFVH